MTISHTTDIVLLDGPDAVAFAQSQFSSNVALLANGKWQFSAWLDAQGRVRALFQLARLRDECLMLLLRGGSAASLAEALRRYVFRMRVKIIAPASWRLGTGPAQPTHTVVVEEPGTVRLGCGEHSMLLGEQVADDDAWRLPQLRAGWPWLPANSLGELLPAALSLYRLQAVAIDKGCYPGQEIVARTHYRGGHKRHLYLVALSHAATAGTPLRRDGRELAQLLDVLPMDDGAEALAVMPDDVAAEFTNDDALIGDDSMRLTLRHRWPA